MLLKMRIRDSLPRFPPLHNPAFQPRRGIPYHYSRPLHPWLPERLQHFRMRRLQSRCQPRMWKRFPQQPSMMEGRQICRRRPPLLSISNSSPPHRLSFTLSLCPLLRSHQIRLHRAIVKTPFRSLKSRQSSRVVMQKSLLPKRTHLFPKLPLKVSQQLKQSVGFWNLVKRWQCKQRRLRLQHTKPREFPLPPCRSRYPT
ncbi:hypothetical protein BJ508DRAFT_177161 [Ascobolus immersus RN42]|uniref:Uncharacterized protein n=1 Tax=Ascobolus immersus RN42 TaxID=1160509 RepID=A0A3N4IH72_ASCIM|nr:hypothetical protein BJ508DRAFT_177161 [Ascobolus immersus RN42]